MISASILVGILAGLTGTILAIVSGMGVIPSLLIYPAGGLAGMLLTSLLIGTSRLMAQPVMAKVSRGLS